MELIWILVVLCALIVTGIVAYQNGHADGKKAQWHSDERLVVKVMAQAKWGEHDGICAYHEALHGNQPDLS